METNSLYEKKKNIIHAAKNLNEMKNTKKLKTMIENCVLVLVDWTYGTYSSVFNALDFHWENYLYFYNNRKFYH